MLQDIREEHLPQQIQLVNGASFTTEMTEYVVLAEDGLATLVAFKPGTREPKDSAIAGHPILAVRAEFGKNGLVRFAKPIEGEVVALTSEVTAVKALYMGTTMLASPDMHFGAMEETARIRWQAQIEQVRFKDFPVFMDDRDIDRALFTGHLVQMGDSEELGYKISGKMKYPYTTRTMKQLVIDIAAAWRAELGNQNLDPRAFVLIITSLVRTAVYQQQLLAGGEVPAAVKSTHCNGYAVDIANKWLRAEKPDYYAALIAALGRMIDQGRITVIQEDNIGCLHISLRVQWLGQQKGFGTGLIH